MAEPITINPNQPINEGLDYVRLKALGTAELQQLSGDIWTDYNEHDPGVTTLEQLCYALTELSYRAEFPLQDILMPGDSEKISSQRQALYTAESILTCNPVTTNDYRKLVVDRIKGVGNVWFTEYDPEVFNSNDQSIQNVDPTRQFESENDALTADVKGLYLISVYVPDSEACHCDDIYEHTSIKEKVNRLYAQHRDLCEDVARIEILTTILAEVGGVVSITGNASANKIVADILFSISLLFAPEVERTSVQKKMMLGEAPASFLQGPLLFNGLIDDKQLQAKAPSISVNEVARAILQVEGVSNVTDLVVVLKTQGKSFSGNDEIPVAPCEILNLETNFGHSSSAFPIVVIRKGVEIPINGIVVNRELKKLWQSYRKTYHLKAQYREYFDLPIGQHRKLAQYYSIQNQYPNVYGINEYGIAESEPKQRQAQAKQFKGYLLVFEQILADYLSQLENVKNLYCTDPGIKQSYFYQYLDKNVPNVEPLLKTGQGTESYHQGLPTLISNQDPFVLRRNRFLNVLLAMYGQTLDSIYLPAELESEYEVRLVNAKIVWLTHLISGTNDRGRAMDYLDRCIAKNISGMQIKTRIQLGMNVFNPVQLDQLCIELGLELVSEDGQASMGKLSTYHSDDLKDEFTSLDNVTVVQKNSNAGNRLAGINNDVHGKISGDEAGPNEIFQLMFGGQKVTEEFIEAATVMSNYRIGRSREQNNVVLLCRSHHRITDWHFIKRYSSFDVANIAANELVSCASQLNQGCSQLYLVEHNLLRFSMLDDNGLEQKLETDENSAFNYSFTFSAVVSAAPDQLASESYMSFARETIRENSPANLALDYCFIGSWKMVRFEKIYWSWRRALRNQNREKIIRSSIRLRRFLEQNSMPGRNHVND